MRLVWGAAYAAVMIAHVAALLLNPVANRPARRADWLNLRYGASGAH